jgi:CubicO group peptidase (beta-lactamase class C family)
MHSAVTLVQAVRTLALMTIWLVPATVTALLLPAASPGANAPRRATEVAIVGNAFHINGQPTYAGRTWRGKKVEGLLLNSRMVQGIYDDLNPDTKIRWAYPDTKKWDADRNTREFVAAMAEWRKAGLLGFTINLQGGSPQGYSREQPWHNSAITPEGDLRPEYMARLKLILDRADELGMAPILGIFYFGQDERLKDEAAVIRAVDNTVDWIFEQGYRNVLIEVNNECNVRYDHAILQPQRVHELIERVKGRTRDGRRLLVGTSYGGGKVPEQNVVRTSDFILIHGNGVKDPRRIGEMVRQTREVPGYRPMPIVFNEDDHFDFDKPENNFTAAIGEYASWGYFDFRMQDEGFDEGYQSVPVNWGISSERKKGFFGLVKEITMGAEQENPVGESQSRVFPSNTWQTQSPAQLGLDEAKLAALRELVKGNGIVVRQGQIAFTWGDVTKSQDIASAAKPFISLLMLKAVEEGKLASVDDRLVEFEPRLAPLNGGKDAAITWRQLAHQTSGYGLTERPGESYAYNDFALALYYLTLTEKVFREPGTDVFRARVAGPLDFEDDFAFRNQDADRPGRLSISVRDLARLGLLFLCRGRWREEQILRPDLVDLMLAQPLPADFPLSAGKDADMIPGQKSLGGGKTITTCGPGFYAFNWWLNKADREGRRLYAALPEDAYLACGHGGSKMLWIVPSLDLVCAWRTEGIDDHDTSPGSETTVCARAARLLAASVQK